MRRFSIYIVFSAIIIVAFIILVRKLDMDAVNDLEANFNQQQAVQVDLASRSFERQSDQYIQNVVQVATDLASATEHLHFYDSSGNRLLYSARSVNQISITHIESQLEHLVDEASINSILVWGYFGQDQVIFVQPDNPNDVQIVSHRQQLSTWVDMHAHEITDGIYVTSTQASPDEQIIGILYPVVSSDGSKQGILGTVVTLTPLMTQIIDPIRSGQFGAAWVQDFDGQVIFDHESEIIGQSVFDLHKNHSEVLALDNRYPIESTGVSEYLFTVERGGEVSRKLVAWNTATLANQKFTVALSAPDTEISALLSSSRQTSLLLGIVLTISLVGSGWFFNYIRENELLSLVAERTRELEHEQQRLKNEIIERERAEAALRTSEMNFRQLAENVREVFFLIDTMQNKVVYVSPSYDEIWQSDIQLLNQTLFVLTPTIYADDRSLVREQLKSFLHSPEQLSTEFRIVRGDGEVRWIRWRAFPVDDNDVVQRVICTAEDITLQKLARDAEVSVEIERNRIQLLANFVQDAFHEFRTPLSIINTSVYLLDNVSEVDKRKEYLQFIREESKNIMHLVEQLVTMSRLDIEEPFRIDNIHVDTMMRDLEIMLQPEIDAANLQSTWQLSAPSYYVKGDLEQLHKAIKNILHNGIKYSNAGDCIFVRTMMDKNHVVIEVADTGEGIDPQQIDNIFQRFYRVDKAHSTRGFGLGLPIAHRIVERHGGAITAQSEPGVGSTFRILLHVSSIMELDQIGF